jgi:hypothetical protein
MLFKIVLTILFSISASTWGSSCDSTGATGNGCRTLSTVPTSLRAMVNEAGFKIPVSVTLKNISPISQKVRVKISDFRIYVGLGLNKCEPSWVRCGSSGPACDPAIADPDEFECRPMFYCDDDDGNPEPGGFPTPTLTDICEKPCNKTRLTDCHERKTMLVRKQKRATFTEYWSKDAPILVAAKQITRSSSITSFIPISSGNPGILFESTWKQHKNLFHYYYTDANLHHPTTKETINFPVFDIAPNTVSRVAMTLFCRSTRDKIRCYFNTVSSSPSGFGANSIPTCSDDKSDPRPCLNAHNIHVNVVSEVHVYNDRGAIMGSWGVDIVSAEENESGNSIPFNGGRPF